MQASRRPYRSERNENWLKTKAVQKGKFPVVGFIKDPSGSLPSTLVSRKARTLSTWARSGPAGLALSPARSGNRVSPKSKLTRRITKPKATWVEPKFYADVEYWDITSDGLLRASSFKRLSLGLSRK